MTKREEIEKAEIGKKINLIGRSLILAYTTWSKNTAEHQQARDNAIDDFTTQILKLFEPMSEERIIRFEKSALKDICEALNIPYDKDIIGFTKYGVIKKPLKSEDRK